MLINNTEALKSWLVEILEPLCDADSSALARYVLALLKKDKPEKELKRVMIEQLDVFLVEETKPFVERLLEAISTEEYLKNPLPTANNPKAIVTGNEDAEVDSSIANNAAVANVASSAATSSTSSSNHTSSNINTGASTTNSLTTESNVTNVINQNDNIDTINSVSAKVIDNNAATTSSTYADKVNTPPIDESKTKDTTTERTSSLSSTSHHQSSSSQYHGHHHHHNAPNRNETHSYGGSGTDRHHHHPRSASPPAARTNAADKENQPRESRRRRASLRSRSRSRSRSNERFSRRSRSRDRRINEREKTQRQFRNKSPPMGSGDSRHDRRRGGGGGVGNDRRRMIMNNMGGGSSDDRSPRFGGGDRRGSGGGNNVNIGGPGNRSTNRSPISPRSRSPSLERGGRTGKLSPSAGRSQVRSGGNVTSGGAGAVALPDTRHHHNNDGEKRQRCRDFDEKGYCVRGETCPWDHGVNPVVFEGLNNSALISMSLREYNPDAPDLWSRSAPPAGAIVAGSTPGALMAGTAAASINPFTGTARPSAVMMTGPAGSVGFSQVPGSDKPTNGAGPLAAAEYARTAAVAAAAGAGFRAAAPMMPFAFNPAAVTTPLQRELIPIPVVDASGGAAVAAGGDVTAAMQAQSKRRFELEDSVAIADGPTKRKIPAHSRLGPRIPSLQNCSLELRKVPRGLNSIAHLNNHFAKFGKIVNIQISYDGDPEAAIVTFSTHAEANVAYRSTEAVLNNRFIKVFWHTADTSLVGENNSTMTMQTGGRKNSQYHLNNVPAVPTPTADSAKTANPSQTQTLGTSSVSSSSISCTSTQDTVTTTTANSGTSTTTAGTVAATHVAPPSLRLKNNIPSRTGAGIVPSAAFRKKQEEQVKAVAQLANGLRKRKQELLQSYVKQMKSALELVERCEPSDPQRGPTLATIKVLQETIDKLRKEIAAEQEQIQAQFQNQNQPPPAKKSKEQQKKELLDIELELFAQQQEGNDTTAIQKRLEELQRSLGIVPGTQVPGSPMGAGKPGHYMPGGRPIPRGRGSYPEGSTRVDRRPKTIVVTGFSSEDADFVLGHFKHFGEITKHDMDLEKPQLILSYATRINAEQAVLRGKVFKDKRLQIAWAPVVQTLTVATTAGNKSATPIVENKTTGTGAYQPQEARIAIASPTYNPTSPTYNPTPPTYNNPTSPYYTPVDNETDANNTDTLPELRLEDEEEDEESEDRSWRR